MYSGETLGWAECAHYFRVSREGLLKEGAFNLRPVTEEGASYSKSLGEESSRQRNQLMQMPRAGNKYVPDSCMSQRTSVFTLYCDYTTRPGGV